MNSLKKQADYYTITLSANLGHEVVFMETLTKPLNGLSKEKLRALLSKSMEDLHWQ